MRFEIIPYTSFGGIGLSMTKDIVKQTINAEPKEFLRNEFSTTPTVAYSSLGLYINYNDNQQIEAIEAAAPAEVIFQDKNLLDIPYSQLLEFIFSLDPEIEEDGNGFISKKFGFGVYAPAEDDANAKVESVIVFQEGYYD